MYSGELSLRGSIRKTTACHDRRPVLRAQQVLREVPGCGRYCLVCLLATRGRCVTSLVISSTADSDCSRWSQVCETTWRIMSLLHCVYTCRPTLQCLSRPCYIYPLHSKHPLDVSITHWPCGCTILLPLRYVDTVLRQSRKTRQFFHRHAQRCKKPLLRFFQNTTLRTFKNIFNVPVNKK